MNAPTQLTLKFRPGLRLTDRAFGKLCAANRDMRLERTARGELIVMSPAGSESGRRNGNLTLELGLWARRDGTGIFFDSSAGFTLANGAIRSPDASWVALDRWNALTSKLQKKFSPLCPDFVVELCSPSDRRTEVEEKLREYIEQGARLGWLIDPEAGMVEIYRPGQPVEVLERPATLSGEDVLPGFVLNLKGILFD